LDLALGAHLSKPAADLVELAAERLSDLPPGERAAIGQKVADLAVALLV
jgi:hypothetical protein